MKRKIFSSGFTLMECLVYIALLAIVLNFVFGIYYKSEKFMRRSGQYLLSLQQLKGITNSLRKDIRNAYRVVPYSENFKSSADTLILQLSPPNKEISDPCYVVYTFNPEEKLLKKIISQPGKSYCQREWRNLSCVQFLCNVPSLSEVQLVDVRLSLKRKGEGKIGLQREFHFLTFIRNVQKTN